jgi:GxxExxY protein
MVFMQDDPLTYEIIGAAIAVSKYWGNGLLENVYKKSLVIKLRQSFLDVDVEFPMPGVFEGVEFDVTFKADIVVNKTVIIEAKAIKGTPPVFRSQLLTYMRLSSIPTGLLFNFHEYPFTKNGIIRLSL